MRESWADEGLDDFRENADRRFDQIDRRFEQIEQRFDALYRLLLGLGATIVATLLASRLSPLASDRRRPGAVNVCS